MVPCEISSVLFKDSEGITNSILSIVDLRERLLLQKNIDLKKEKIVADNIVIAQSVSDTRHAQNSDWIRSINKTSYDLIWDWDIPANIISFGNTYDKIFGYKLPGNKIGFKEWIALFLPEEGDMLASKIKSALATEKANWEDSYSFTCADGSAGQVSSRANIIRDNNGNPIRMIGVMRDLSKQQQREEMHEEQIRKKELEIVEAIVEAKEMERSDIGKELHDNINQLLGASMLYLDMARKDLNNGEIYLIHSSEYTLSAIEEIRKLTRGLTNVIIADFGLCGAIEHTCEDIMEVSGVKIHYALDHALEETMSAKFKLNAFRILQEQLNNIVKHAKASTINISLSKAASGFQLSIADDGVGFDSTQKSKGIGISNIVSRTELYKGNAHFISEPGKGCMLAVTFPAA